MQWYLVCSNPKKVIKLSDFPIIVGRDPQGDNVVRFGDRSISREQFVLDLKFGSLYLDNCVPENPTAVDGTDIEGRIKLVKGNHIVYAGFTTIGVGTDCDSLCRMVEEDNQNYFCVQENGEEFGPWTEAELLDACENGQISRNACVWYAQCPEKIFGINEIVDFDDTESISAPIVDKPSSVTKKRHLSSEEVQPELGESFMCPYCRTVSDLEDVLSVSVSPSLIGDPVLGQGEQVRFLPSQFTNAGLALDSEGGVCTEIACPRCHMALPRTLLETPQIVMSVVGAAGSGKSVFLASSMWQCRQLLGRLFGVSFMDLDPVANRWINAYEEKLFFQEDDQKLQQIAKTEINASNVCRPVKLDGDDVLLPLPSFFQLRSKTLSKPQSLVVYDSAGEHFRAGADTQSSAVTLNMLNADSLFFLFDPSADPRFRPMLDRGNGTACNYAQRQDVLLAEMAARIRRHMGNKSEMRLTKPLIFGISKADLLRHHLPLEVELYKELGPRQYALDFGALKKVSEETKSLLMDVVPEVVATAQDIAEEIWFVPISSLGHNPMNEGVRPCDIKPQWTELPVVFTLAKKGLIPSVGENL